MGNTDRIIRAIIAIVIGVLYFTGTITGLVGMVLTIVAGVFLATSLMSVCPLYALFGMNTCPSKKA